MADLIIVPSSVIVLPGRTKIIRGIVGGAATLIEAGQFVYRDANGVFFHARNLAAVLAEAKGMAIADSFSGQPLHILTFGEVDIGSAIEGDVYCISDAAGGKIKTRAELAANALVTTVGVGRAGGILSIDIQVSGEAVQP